MQRIKPHLTYANVIATLALFLVLAGGGAYAAKKLKLKRNAVKTKNIKNLAVTEPKIGDKAVTNPKIGDKQVKTGKLGEGSVTGAKLDAAAVSADKTDFIVKSGRVTANPPNLASDNKTLVSTAGVTLTGTCLENGATHTGGLTVNAPANSQAAGYTSVGGSGQALSINSASFPFSITQISSATADARYVSLNVLTPSTTVNLQASYSVNVAGTDCAFSGIAVVG